VQILGESNPIVLAGHWHRSKRRALRSHMNPGLEVVYVAAGQPVWHVDGRAERVSAGSVFFTLPWQAHGGVAEREPGLSISFAVLALDRRYTKPMRTFGFHPALGLNGNEGRHIARLLRESDRHAHPATSTLAWLVPRVVDEFHQGSTTMAATLARAVVLELGRCLDTARSMRDQPSEAERRVATFLETLAERCAQPWTLQNMAAACGLGRTRFSQIVKARTGDPPIMALNRMRVAQAQQLLRSTDRAVTQIALDCGFSSTQYFSRVFREYTGSSASAERARHG